MTKRQQRMLRELAALAHDSGAVCAPVTRTQLGGINRAIDKRLSPLCGWRGLTVHLWQARIDASPLWSASSPDCHGRLYPIGLVEGPDPHEYQVRSGLRLAKKWCSTSCAESAVHSIPAVGHTHIVGGRPADSEGCRSKACVDSPATRAKILTLATPAHPRDNRCF
jgi:hypothetical protein